MSLLKDKGFLRFLIIFLVVFLLCYYGSIAVIGLTAPGDYYSPFLAKYLNYISWLRNSLLNGSQWLLSLFGDDTYYQNEYVLSQVNGRGVKLVYSCLGLGVMSFWIAFITASVSFLKRKIIWILSGLFVIWLINIIRISLLLVSLNHSWKMPFGIDHHTWFNIVAYGVIFLMMYLFSKAKVKRQNPKVIESTILCRGNRI
ncbi:MAG TPA: hypothetical protein VK498_09450 [Ferruginibacter sp.]|nr:hypothetical protein [Ferruginibacter sp.]